MSHEPWEPCDAPPTPEPRSAAEWAHSLVVDQIHEQTKCECQYLGDTLTTMCTHHEFQKVAIGNALNAFAAQECAALRERSNQNALDHAKVVDERNAFQAALTEAQSKHHALKMHYDLECEAHASKKAYIHDLKVERDALQQRVEALETQDFWVIEEGVEGEGTYTLAICRTESDALKIKAHIEQERGHSCPDLIPEVYHLPDEYEAALRGPQ